MRRINWIQLSIVAIAGIFLGMNPALAVNGEPAKAGESADGVPIYSFGRAYVYGLSPDFQKNVVLQEGNDGQKIKIKPIKSRDLVGHRLGAMPTSLPHLPSNDVQPYQCISMIDGKPSTFWCSRGHSQPDVQTEWIRLDLPVETKIKEITILPRLDGAGIPSKLTVKVSRDAWHWDTVYENKSQTAPKDGLPISIPFASATSVKQVWILGENLTPSLPSYYLPKEYAFSVAEVKVIDEQGNNAALADRGTGVTVSSTWYTDASQYEVYDNLWPTLYDLGAGWLRLSGWGGPLMWDNVEREKGKYYLDPKADAAITEASQNGCKVMITLCYGNWLYVDNPEAARDAQGREVKGRPELPFPLAAEPPFTFTPEQVEGYKNYCRFMAKHFKGRAYAYEIWNEGFGFPLSTLGMSEVVRLYCDMLKQVVAVIKAEDPNAKISFVGLGGPPDAGYNEFYDDPVDKHDVMKLVDLIGWHCQTAHVDVTSDRYKNYPKYYRDYARRARAKGFKGQFMATENWWSAGYPAYSFAGVMPTTFTEIQKAKDMARLFMIHLGLDVIPFYTNTWLDQVQLGGGLFRTTFSADPISPMQPEPSYYVFRTLSTVMDQAMPNESLQVSFSNASKQFVNYNFDLPDTSVQELHLIRRSQKYVAVWLPDKSVDVCAGEKTDVRIKGVKATKVYGIDVLNGFQQELAIESVGADTVVHGVVVRDYPLILKAVYEKEKK